MIIKFDKLELHNFLSIGHVELELNGNGYVLVRGENKNVQDSALSNGSGKSSIWDGLCWCLTGQTMRGGSKDVTNLHAPDNDGVYAKVSFTIDNDEYVIIRAKNHSVYKSSVQLFVNGKDCSGSGVRDGGKVLAERVPDITYQFLTSVVLLGQGLPGRFSNNTPSGRKDVIESLSKSEYMIEDIKARIDRRRVAIESALEAEKQKLWKTQTEIDTNNRTIERANTDLLSLGNLEETTAELEKKKREYASVVSELSILKSGLDDYTNRYTVAKDDLTEFLSIIENEYREKISEEDKKLQEIKTRQSILVTKADFLYKDIQKKKSITDVCPTCGQKISGIVIPDTKEQEEELHKINEEIRTLDEPSVELNRNICSLKEECKTKQAEERAKCADHMASLLTEKTNREKNVQFAEHSKSDIEREMNALEVKVKVYESKKAELEKTISELTARNAELEEILKTVNTEGIEELLAINKKFQTVAGRDFRGYLISGILEYISAVAGKYSEVVYGSKAVSVQIDKNNINIVYNDRLYEDLSGGEKQKVDVIIQLAIRDMMCKYVGLSTNIIILDEIFDNLDSIGCDKILNLVSNALQDVSSTYIITHHSDIDIPYDKMITMCKNANGVSEML